MAVHLAVAQKVARTFVSRDLRIFCLSHYRAHSVNATCAPEVSKNMFCLNNYDAVGFDLDHTICKYKLRHLNKLIYETLGNYLVEKCNYSKKILDVSSTEFTFAQKGLILDKARGNFLKLDNNYSILKACHGTQCMTEEEIRKNYGPERIWEVSKGIPNRLCYKTSLDEPYYVFKDYFVVAGAVLCAKIVDILDEQNGGPLPYYSFWEDFLNGLLHMYERHNFVENSGEFFPALKQNPERYLEQCTPELKKWLMNLHKKKLTFLLTGSNFDSASFLAEYSLGKDWLKYFDVILTFARKPGFFHSHKSFYQVAEGKEEKVKSKDMKPHVLYTQGNWQDLYDLCSRLCSVKNPKLLYVGDSLVEDVYAPSCFGQCDTIAVVEEILEDCMTESTNFESINVLSSNIWGSFFISSKFNDDVKARCEKHLTLWASILSQNSKLAVSNLNEICNLKIQDTATSFLENNPTAGYYPEIPGSLKGLLQERNI